MQISEHFILEMKRLNKLTDDDPPIVIEACFDIFGENFGEKQDVSNPLERTEQLFLLKAYDS